MTDISNYEFRSDHEPFKIRILKITDLTMARAVRLYNVWPFWIAKICKDWKQIVYVWNCNIRYSIFSGAFSRRKLELTNNRKVISVKCAQRKIPARGRVSFGGYSVFVER